MLSRTAEIGQERTLESVPSSAIQRAFWSIEQVVAEKTSWWIDYASLPEHELWARLEIEESGKATVRDCDGRVHKFSCSDDARNWLIEDEYSMVENIDAEEFMNGCKPLPPA